MSRLSRQAIAVPVLLCLVLMACGNSADDDTSTTTTPGGSVGAPDGGAAERDTFVELSGVPGVTDDEISFALIGTKTGNPLGNCILDCYTKGVEAYFEYRNSQGGIFGRDLVVGEVIDDELSQNQQKALDVISGDSSFGVFQATLLATGWGDLDQAGIPTYAWGIHATEAANRAGIFPSLVARCADCPRPTVPFIASEVGATKAASIGYGVSENSKVCTKTVAEAFDQFEDDSGVEVVYTNDTLGYGLPNGIGPEVTAMKDAGVDFISTCIDLNGMKTLAQELQRQGMDDVVLNHPNTYDAAFVAEAGDLFEGDVVSVQFRPFEADGEGTALADFLEWIAEVDAEPTELAMVGWINASTAFDGLLAAGPEFDRAKVTAATNAMTDYTAGGLLVPVNWGTSHIPYTAEEPVSDGPQCAAYVRIEDGEFVPMASPAEPWFCWANEEPLDFQPELATFD